MVQTFRAGRHVAKACCRTAGDVIEGVLSLVVSINDIRFSESTKLMPNLRSQLEAHQPRSAIRVMEDKQNQWTRFSRPVAKWHICSCVFFRSPVPIHQESEGSKGKWVSIPPHT
jgi:hypothetical protein